jgi:hypothetical protein
MAEFNLYALPLELPLEIFGFLSHDDWTRLAGFNRGTHNVMMNNLRYLAPLTHCAYLHMQMVYSIIKRIHIIF